MSNITRDTQFAGFAKALYEDFKQLAIEDDDDLLSQGYFTRWIEKVERCIAQRAYDLVDHTVCWIDPMDYMSQENPCEFIIKSIPDLTEFPT